MIRLLTLCGCEKILNEEIQDKRFIEIALTRPMYPLLNVDPNALVTFAIRRFEYIGDDYLFNGERRKVYREVT